jgi:hypothetical protein
LRARRIAKSRSIGTAALLAVAVIAALVSGCGDSAEGGGSDAYRQFLTGFNEAVLANETYGANDKAEELDTADRAVVEAFCAEEEKLVLNNETFIPTQRPHWISRTFVTAERMPSNPPPEEVRESEDELIEVLGSSFFNGSLDTSFEKACSQ